MELYSAAHLSKLRGAATVDEDRLQHLVVFLELINRMSEKGGYAIADVLYPLSAEFLDFTLGDEGRAALGVRWRDLQHCIHACADFFRHSGGL